MNRLAARRLADSLALLAVTFLAACSGAVSGPPASSGPIIVSPNSAVLYSDVPTTFLISGGTGSYLVTSSDQTALPVAGTSGSSLTVVPGTVGADTTVTLTVRDSAGSLPATASLTIRPRTVSNVVTITPSSTECGSSICAGGDAVVSVVLAQNGVPLAGRTVRFDVASGDLRVYTASAGQTDVLATSGVAVTDGTGTASVRVHAGDNAVRQSALLDIVDTSSGAVVRTAVPIAPIAATALSAQPSTIAFQGTSASSCANGISADILVSGGKPPYTVSQPGVFAVSPSILTSDPGRVTVTATGQCAASASIVILDGAGATATVTASNSVSSVTPTPFTVAPDTVTLSTCGSVANVALAGGTGTYYGVAGSDLIRVDAGLGATTGSIQRNPGTNAAGTSTVTAAFSDGQTSKTVTVKLAGDPAGHTAAGTCP